MAYVERRGKAWRGRYRRPDGAWGSTSGFSTKAAALAAANDEESRIRRNTWIDPRAAKIPFAEFAEEWYAAVAPGLGPRTVENYRMHLDRHLLPRWGTWPMISIFNSHLEIQRWVTGLHAEYEDASVRTFFGTFSVVMNAAVRARIIPASPCAGIRVTEGGWEPDRLVATPAQVLRAAMRLHRTGIGFGGFVLGILSAHTGARWGELAGQTRREYDELNQAIAIVEPLKEVNGRLIKGGQDVTEWRSAKREPADVRQRQRRTRGARTKSPAGERWIRLSPTTALLYERLLESLDSGDAFAFVSSSGSPWYRSNFRQRHWRPAWDGVHPDDPEATGHRPALLPGFRFHEGRHTHSTWLLQDGIPEVARRARLGHKMPGIARVYEHVTPEMEQQISAALEARWAASLAELTEGERTELTGLVPDLAPLVRAARRRPGSGTVSQISPTGSGREE